MSKWFCSDSDCCQYTRIYGDYVYGFIQVDEYSDDYYIAREVVLDVRDFSIDELEEYCAPFYTSLDVIVAQYGVRESLRIMAECIFESMDYDDMEFNIRFSNFAEAKKFVEDWIVNPRIQDELDSLEGVS